MSPTTVSPTTTATTTDSPTTVSATTIATTTVSPTTDSPTTIAKTTVLPTTDSPTTYLRTTTGFNFVKNKNISTLGKTHNTDAYILNQNTVNNDSDYNWIWALVVFFMLVSIFIYYVVKKHKYKNVIYPKQIYLEEKGKNESFNTIIEIEQELKKEKEKIQTQKHKNKKLLSEEAYKHYLKKKYPNVDFELAHSLHKNRELMKRVHKQLQNSKIKKVKNKKQQKKKKFTISEIPTEKVDFSTAMKIDKLQPKMATIANVRVKNDRILKMMRDKKVVKNKRQIFKK